jgi:O-antigen/teichoic acid export membrane protein
MSPKRLLQSRFLRDSLLLQASGALVALCQLLSASILAHSLGETAQGRYISAVKVYGLLFMLFNTGIVPAVVSQVGAAVIRGQIEKIAAWQGFLVKAYLITGLLLVSLGWAVLPPFTELAFENRELGVWAFWLCFAPLLECGRVLAMCSFQGLRLMKDLAHLDVYGEFGRFALVAGAAYWFESAQAVVLATLLSGAWGSLVGLWLYRRSLVREAHGLPSLERVFQRMKDVRLADGLPLGLRLGLLRSLDALHFDLLPPLLMFYAGVAKRLPTPEDPVAYFNNAQRLMLIPAVLMTGIARNTLPAMSGIAGRKDPELLRRSFWKVTVLGGLFNAVGLLGVLLLMPWVLEWFLPASYHAPVIQLAWIIGLAGLLKGFAGAYDSFYIVADRLRVTLRINLIGTVVCLGLLVKLTLDNPVTGAAWGMVIANTWGLLHMAYIAWFFHTGQHRRLFVTAPETTAPPAPNAP